MVTWDNESHRVIVSTPAPQANADLHTEFITLHNPNPDRPPFEDSIWQRAGIDRNGTSLACKLIQSIIALFQLRCTRCVQRGSPQDEKGKKHWWYFWSTQIYFAPVVEFWNVLGNAEALEEFASGQDHLMCMFCCDNTFSLRSNPNQYVGEVRSRPHDHGTIHQSARLLALTPGLVVVRIEQNGTAS